MHPDIQQILHHSKWLHSIAIFILINKGIYTCMETGGRSLSSGIIYFYQSSIVYVYIGVIHVKNKKAYHSVDIYMQARSSGLLIWRGGAWGLQLLVLT